MEFEEVFTSPFTTQTTCYSGGKKRLGSDSVVDLQFATENHVLSARLPITNDVQISCRSLPRDASNMTCVGYASWEEEEDSADDTAFSVYRMEAMTLMDPELLEINEASSSTDAILHRPSAEKDDPSEATIDGRSQNIKRASTSTVNSSSNHPLGGFHRNSHSELSLAASTTSSHPLSSRHRKSTSELSKESHLSESLHTSTSIPNTLDASIPNSEAVAPQKSSKARLVLKQDQYSIRKSLVSKIQSDKAEESQNGCDTEDSDGQAYRRQLRQSSFALLDFRPLCPCIATWGDSFVGIWVGSADDAVLRLYAPSRTDPRSLIPIPLPEEHFFVHSPVMGLDFCSVTIHGSTRNTLAVACQDGTIQLISWKDTSYREALMGKDLFGDLWSQKIIVDGPLVCLKLNYNPLTALRVLVGSLCGFACQLTLYDDSKQWEGPHMVVQDLYNTSFNMEESVLAVDLYENYVAIGTQLGRCLLYATHDSENYFLVWQAVLPYPVHDIAILATANNTDITQKQTKKRNPLRLAVTTRRSFHVFSGVSGGVVWKQTSKRERYNPELATMKLQGILEGIRKTNEASDLATLKSVRGVVEDLLVRVETNNNEDNEDNTATIVSDTINNLMDRVQEYVASNSPETVDAPHWEYSSSDEEEEDTIEDTEQSVTKEEAEC